MDNDLQQLKQVVEGYMIKHNLRGMEVIRPYGTDEIYYRAAGKGRHETGIEIWESLNEFLKGEDREIQESHGLVVVK